MNIDGGTWQPGEWDQQSSVLFERLKDTRWNIDGCVGQV